MSAWTTERPTKAGGWWRRYQSSGKQIVEVVQIFKCGTKLVLSDYGGIVDSSLTGEWQPVQGPVE